MATGHWETRRVINPNPNGPDYIEVQVWVPDPPPSPSSAGGGAAAAAARARAKREAEARARAAAQRAAAQRAAAQRLAEQRALAAASARRAAAMSATAKARHAAYETLKQRQAVLLRQSGLLKANRERSQVAPTRPGQAAAKPLTPRDAERDEQFRRAQAQKVAAAQAAEQQRWATYAHAQKTQAVLKDPKSKLADVERLLAEEAKRAVGGSINSERVKALVEKYVKDSEKVAAAYKALVGKINEAIDAGNVDRAQTLYQSPEFQTLAQEYVRLFGDGRDPRQEGAFNQFWRDYQSIEQAQTDYWKRVAKNTLDADRRNVNRLLQEAKKSGDQEAIAKYEDLVRVYSGQTRTIRELRPDGGFTYRKLTVEEELEHREAERRVEMERLRSQYEAGQARTAAFARAEGLELGLGGRMITHGEAQIERLAADVVKTTLRGVPPDLKRAEDITKFADQIVAHWEKQNRDLFFRGRTRGRTPDAEYQRMEKLWAEARARVEREAFAYFGSGVPAWWDRTFQAPGISHILASLQAPTSAIGGLVRVGNAFIFGESKLGGFSPDFSTLPPSVKRSMEAASKAALREFAAKYQGGRVGAGGGPPPGQGAAERVLKAWLATPEGQKWAESQIASQKQRGSEELAAFAKDFYGEDGDIGAKLDALNQFGSQPFTGSGANLLFQLLADPTNAIPLKFTTYLARAKFAAELGSGSKFLGSSKLGTARDFVKVDEGTLRLRSELAKVLEAGGKDGKSARGLTEELLADLAGIKDKGQFAKIVKAKLVAAGIDPRLVSDAQLFTLIEDAVKGRLAKEGIDYASQADEIKDRIAAKRAEVAAKEKARAEAAARREAKHKAGLEAREAEAAAKRRELQKRRAREEARLRRKANETTGAGGGAPPASGAAQGVSGQPPAPADHRVVAGGAPVEPGAKLPTPQAPPVERKLARTMRVQDPAGQVRKPSGELRRIRRASEYYKPDAMGNWLPKDSRVIRAPRYRELARAAKAGDVGAQRELARIARLRRNIFRLEAEDLPKRSPFTQTDLDLAERAGVLGDSAAEARLLADRETVRHLKRTAAQGDKADEYLREFVRDAGRAIERDFGAADAFPSASRVNVGEDIIAARDSMRGLNDAYETFSGLPNRTQYYAGGYFEKVRDATWRKKVLGPKRFTRLLNGLDNLDDLYGVGGVAAFRDGGQILFELFHRLRLDRNYAKLKRLSQTVDAYLADLADPADSLFAWQWKVMEERAGLPWAWNYELIEDGFLRAAERWNMHPNLALAMIPNGFFAHRAPNRFRLSSALLGFEQSSTFKAAPAEWVESDALRAVTETFTKGNAGHATRIVSYTGERFGSFAKAFKLRNRIADELTGAVRREMSTETLADILMDYAAELPELVSVAQRLGRDLRDLIVRTLDEKPGVFPNGTPKRPEYAPLRDAVQAAYWDGKLGLPNAEAHKLMLLAHLQDNPKSFVAATGQYVNYMVELGQIAEAKAFLRELFAERIDHLASRYAAERLGHAERTVDTATGEVVDISVSPEWKLWDDLGFTPDTDRVRAWLDGIQRGEVVALDGSDARKLKQLGQYDDEESLLRDLAASVERDVGPAAYAGTVDVDMLRTRIDDKLADFRAAKEAGERGAVRHLHSAVNDLERAVNRLLYAGISGEELEAIRDLAVFLKGEPEGRFLLDELTERVGDEGLARWLSLANGWAEYRQPRRVPERQIRPALGETEQSSTREGRRAANEAIAKKEAELAARPEVEPGSKFQEPPETVIELPAPRDTEGIARAQALLEALTKMSEEDYWKSLSARAFKVLRDDTASAKAKAAARQVIEDIKQARYAKRSASSGGAFIPSSERSRFRNRVLKAYGKDAGDMIAPKQVAPYVEDAQGLAVEQSRTYWRLLRSASPDAADPGARAILKGKVAVDHLPKDVFEQLDQRISDAIAEFRGQRADVRTRSHRPGKPDSQRPIGKMSDSDPEIVRVKREALRKFKEETGWSVSVKAYDEARKVLWRGHVQNKSATWLHNRATEIVARFGGEYKEVYKRLRQKEARAESQRQLGMLAWGEMYGHSPEEIWDEFVARYTDDGQLRHFTPELTDFQKRTLEEHVKALSGIDDLADQTRVSAWLSSRNTPPLHSRDASRDFLVDIGAWSPRKAELFSTGTESWSIRAEARYWMESYGLVPEWADEHLLGTLFEDIFHDQALYYERMRRWGVFNRQAEIQLRLSGKSAEEIEEAVLKGDPLLGLKGKRELDLQRKYVIDRYGDLVADGDRLIAMPWLMYPDELRDYMSKRIAAGTGLADDLIQSADELAEVERLIGESMDEFWDKYISPKAAEGPIQYEDIFRLSSEIQARLLADPKWAKRYRDAFGGLLNAWATFNRQLVMMQMSFGAVNAIDAPIKGAWYRLTRRGLFQPGHVGRSEDVIRRAEALTPQSIGIDIETTIYRMKQRPVKDYLTKPIHKGIAGAIERASALPRGAARLAPEVAGRAEVAVKMRLAKGMYPAVYEEALAKLGDQTLADAFARKFIREEVDRMWPTLAKAGPLEKLWNRFIPFSTYMVKNKVLFLSEALAHPSILNQIDYIGRFIEEENLKNWREEHGDEPMPEAYRRRIELPWAPGYYLDLGQFSDATRGLKPIYKALKAQSYKDFVADWVRIVNPSAQAGIYMLTNALGVTQRVTWKAIYNADGFITGYEKVIKGWTEPWSQDHPTLASVFWFVDAWEEAQNLGMGGLSNGELSVLIGKLTLFDAISMPERGASLFELYKAMKDRNAEQADRWLKTSENGKYLQDWLMAKRDQTKPYADWWTLVNRWDVDPKRWFHSQSAEFQNAVKDAYERIDLIRTAYEEKMFGLDRGTNEYREAKAEMLFYISEVYRLTPELMIHEVYSKSAAEWSKQLQKWQTNMKVDEFFALDKQRPKRADFADVKSYNAALEAWRHQKELFLKMYPDVERALGGARDEYQRVRDQVEKEWDEVLNRVSKRNELIEAAKARGDREAADLLYLQNELDFSILERDYAALYFTDEDFVTLPKGALGPPSLKDGALQKASILLDFDRVRFEKARREGREAQFLADQKYAQGMKEVILAAKGGDPFGKFDPAKFVRALKGRPGLLAQYFAKNPGKEAQWKQNDAYIQFISKWGKLAAAGKWDEAQRVWDRLPQWVKDRYYAKHPDRRQRAIQSAEFGGWMQRWVAYFERDDVKGGMEFFWSMPSWVRERYFSKHPEKRAKWEAQLKFGKQLSEYFAADKAGQAAYLESHPELKEWLFRNVSDEEKHRVAVLAGYAEIPKEDAWLRRVYREKYPEVFSAEAKGERRLRTVYDRLAAHPEFLPDFEKWVAAIWASYAELLKNRGARPKPLKSDHSRRSRHARQSLSAAEVSSG